MKILHLTLKASWFWMIASGEKREEYRMKEPALWKEKLRRLHEVPENIEELKGIAIQAAGVYGFASSVDIAMDVSGKWWLTDMATAEDSYHWPECKLKNSAQHLQEKRKMPPAFFHQILSNTMKSIFLFTLTLLTLVSCSDLPAQTSTAEPTAQAMFAVHTEIMPRVASNPTVARNVNVGNSSITACFDYCQTQIILIYAGQAVIEFPGKDPQVYAARVFQIEPRVWLAEIDGGQWVKIYAETGTASLDIAGEFRAFKN